MHILIASDLTGRSVYPLQRAMQLKEGLGAILTVLHVVERGLTTKTEERHHSDGLTVLQNWKRGLADAAQKNINLNVLVGDPFATIIQEVENHQIDLVMVGQPGRRGLKELFIGTTAERVVRFSNRPVLMVNEHSDGSYKRVLVAMDFSHGARRALEWACRIAPDAKMRIVHAWKSPIISFSAKDAADVEASTERLSVQEEQHIKGIVEAVTRPGRRPQITMVEGSPRDAIRGEIGVFNAQLLAMGTHSRSGLAAVTGSLAQSLLAEGACDILVANSPPLV